MWSKILFYAVCGWFLFMAFGILMQAMRTKPRNWGYEFAWMTYALSGIVALWSGSWWILLGGYLLAHLWKLVFRDPY